MSWSPILTRNTSVSRHKTDSSFSSNELQFNEPYTRIVNRMVKLSSKQNQLPGLVYVIESNISREFSIFRRFNDARFDLFEYR